MIGAILGDIIGSPHEFKGADRADFPLITSNRKGENRVTDDSIMTIALADSILNNVPYTVNMKKYYRKYPDKGYGVKFATWCESEYTTPYGSAGNGALMRISPVAWAYNTTTDVSSKARQFTSLTHNDPRTVDLAEFFALDIYGLLRLGISKEWVLSSASKHHLASPFLPIEEYIKSPKMNRTANEIYPMVLSAFKSGNSYEECVRLAICACNDTDTAGCITGALAEIVYGIPQELIDRLPEFLDAELLSVVKQFHDKYINRYKLNF